MRAPFWLSTREVIRMVSSKAAWIEARQKAIAKEPVLPSDKAELALLRKEASVKFLDIAAPGWNTSGKSTVLNLRNGQSAS